MPKKHYLPWTSIFVVSSLILSSCSFVNGTESAEPARAPDQQVSTETLEAEAPDQTDMVGTTAGTLEATIPDQTEIIETPIETLETSTPDQMEMVGTLAVTGDFSTVDCPSQRMAVLGLTDDSTLDTPLYIYCFSDQPFLMASYEVINPKVGMVTGLSASPRGDRIALTAHTYNESLPERLYLFTIDTAEFEVSEFDHGGGKSLTWSNDQAYVAYLTRFESGDDAIIVRHLESGTESTVLVSPELASDQLVTFYNLLWLPESKELVLGAGFGSPARLFSGYKIGIECDSQTYNCSHGLITELPWLHGERFTFTFASGADNSTLVGIDIVSTEHGAEQHVVLQDLAGAIILDIDITDYLNRQDVYNPPSFSVETNQLLFATGKLFVFDLSTGAVTPIDLSVGDETLYVFMASWLP